MNLYKLQEGFQLSLDFLFYLLLCVPLQRGRSNASSFCKVFYLMTSKCFETIWLYNKNWVSSAFLILEMRTNR